MFYGDEAGRPGGLYAITMEAFLAGWLLQIGGDHGVYKTDNGCGKHPKLADRPQLSAQQQPAFDGAGADIKQYLTETLVPEMEAVTAAESIGATYLGDGDPHPENSRNVQAKLNYLYEQTSRRRWGRSRTAALRV